jgi:hypothetical protein
VLQILEQLVGLEVQVAVVLDLDTVAEFLEDLELQVKEMLEDVDGIVVDLAVVLDQQLGNQQVLVDHLIVVLVFQIVLLVLQLHIVKAVLDKQ